MLLLNLTFKNYKTRIRKNNNSGRSELLFKKNNIKNVKCYNDSYHLRGLCAASAAHKPRNI